jgi:hypothetical protein
LTLQTFRRNRTPAQGSAACRGSYWTTTSPTSLKISIHLAILTKTSLRITVSPVFRLNCHLFLRHRFLDCSVSSCKSDKMASLSGWSTKILRLSSSLSFADARAQRSLLQFRNQLRLLFSSDDDEATYESLVVLMALYERAYLRTRNFLIWLIYRKIWNTPPGFLTPPFGLLPHVWIEECGGCGIHPHGGIDNRRNIMMLNCHYLLHILICYILISFKGVIKLVI